MNHPQAPQNSIHVFGIPNCDTVKKARTWLAAQGIDVQFHDFKKQGVPPDAIPKWLAQVDWSILINRKGTTWRQLDDAGKSQRDRCHNGTGAGHTVTQCDQTTRSGVGEWRRDRRI